MKKIIDAVIVVEGKSDVAFLSSYFDAEFVISNGSAISKETIDYLKTIKDKKRIIVLTDPDSPGKRIRDILDQNIDGLEHVFVDKKHAIKNGKVGVAETDIDEINRALKYAFTNTKNDKEYISYYDLMDLGLLGNENSKEKRALLSNKLNIGFNNAKSLYKKLNSLKLNKEDIRKIIYE